MENRAVTFEYTYRASAQDEIRKIREKYLQKEESKLDQLRRLDESVTRKGMAPSLALGIISCLILGIGMCCTMVWDNAFFLPGILIGIIGIIGVSLAYPLYSRITRKERERITPEILRLTNELMGGQP